MLPLAWEIYRTESSLEITSPAHFVLHSLGQLWFWTAQIFCFKTSRLLVTDFRWGKADLNRRPVTCRTVKPVSFSQHNSHSHSQSQYQFYTPRSARSLFICATPHRGWRRWCTDDAVPSLQDKMQCVRELWLKRVKEELEFIWRERWIEILGLRGVRGFGVLCLASMA